MKSRFVDLLQEWLSLRRPTIEGERYTIKNPIVILGRKGVVKLSDGYEIAFNEKNKRDILSVIGLALLTGIHFGDKKYQWRFDQKNEIIETHQGIRFNIRSIGMLDETFLSQIHFSGFDLKGRTVVTAGAYNGDTAFFYSYYGAVVYAFEPSPHSFRVAEGNMALNPHLKKNITLKNYAIGEDGYVEFPVEDNSGSSSIYDKENKETVTTKSVSISTIIDEFKIANPYLLDLDIKGSEFVVIKDSSISNFRKIRIEYSPYLLHDECKSLEFLIEKLKEYGFNQVRIYKHNSLRFDLLSHGVLEAEK